MAEHVHNVIKEQLADFKKNGFRGVRFEYIKDETPRGPEPDEQDQADHEQWVAGYAIFIAQPEIPNCGCEENEFVSQSEFNYHKFEGELTAHLQAKLGNDVAIKYYEGCYEWECHRPGTKPQRVGSPFEVAD
jgi:hypothetical protein